MTMALRHHCELRSPIPAAAPVIFEYLDDPRRLGTHMRKSSWMMAGSRMEYQLDSANGKALGAKIRMSGKILGLTLIVDEVVTRHEPPTAKAWKTVGTPRLLIIGDYEMGFEIQAGTSGSQLTVYIDFELPKGLWWLAGWLLAGFYARWCVRSMVSDAARHFSSSSA